jgi:hypothetical protein
MTARIAVSSRITLRDSSASGIDASPVSQARRLAAMRSSRSAARLSAALSGVFVRLTVAGASLSAWSDGLLQHRFAAAAAKLLWAFVGAPSCAAWLLVRRDYLS